MSRSIVGRRPLTGRGWCGHERPNPLQALVGGEFPSQIGVSGIEPEDGLKLYVTDGQDEDGKKHRTSRTADAIGRRCSPQDSAAPSTGYKYAFDHLSKSMLHQGSE